MIADAEALQQLVNEINARWREDRDTLLAMRQTMIAIRYSLAARNCADLVDLIDTVLAARQPAPELSNVA